MKRPRSGLFAGVRSLPFWLRAVWPGGARAAREEAAEVTGAADVGANAFDASLVPVPRWPRLRAGTSATLDCRRCAVCVAVCPSRALDTLDPDALALDFGRCIGCGLCVERCPEAALELAEGMPVLFAARVDEGLRVVLGERSSR